MSEPTKRHRASKGFSKLPTQWRASVTVVILASLALLVSCGREPSGAGPSQDGRQYTGALWLQVPTGILEGHYWIYANRQILVSDIPTAHFQGMVVPSPGRVDFFNERGRVATLTEVGLDTASANSLEFHTVYKDLPPGHYVLELVTHGRGPHGFPLVIRSRVVDIGPASAQQLVLSPSPHSYDQELLVAREVPCLDADSWMASAVRRAEEQAVELQGDRVIYALAAASQSLANDVSDRSTVYVELPEDVGGPRELDAEQIDMIVDALLSHYSHPSTAELQECASQAPGYIDLLQLMASRYRAVDASLDRLRTLGRRLRNTPSR